MPSLTKADRELLLGPRCYCRRCRKQRIRHYCRSCDEFYATCDCGEVHGHADHRVYLWTTDGIIARPDFDFLHA